MNKIEWKETRKYYARREILYYWTKYKLRQLKHNIFRLWFKISKYKHKHIYSILMYCKICGKGKRDIDREWLEKKYGVR